jgi:2-keto-3-deoxy-L-rhamnonate aldolase RhmA
VGYGQNTGNYLQRANDQIYIMTAVETPEAIENLDEILQVKGLDGIFIGPMDLASSMGYFDDPSQAEVQAAIQTVENKVRAAGKILATTTGTWEQAQKLFERGYQMLMLMADGGALASLAAQKVKQFREQYPNG